MEIYLNGIVTLIFSNISSICILCETILPYIHYRLSMLGIYYKKEITKKYGNFDHTAHRKKRKSDCRWRILEVYLFKLYQTLIGSSERKKNMSMGMRKQNRWKQCSSAYCLCGQYTKFLCCEFPIYENLYNKTTLSTGMSSGLT